MSDWTKSPKTKPNIQLILDVLERETGQKHGWRMAGNGVDFYPLPPDKPQEAES